MSRSYIITEHAVERYLERCQRDGMGQDRARVELERMIPLARFEEEPPKWAYRVRDDNSGYLVLGDVVMVVQGKYLVTCLTKGTLDPHVRARRNRQKRARRTRNAYRRGR